MVAGGNQQFIISKRVVNKRKTSPGPGFQVAHSDCCYGYVHSFCFTCHSESSPSSACNHLFIFKSKESVRKVPENLVDFIA